MEKQNINVNTCSFIQTCSGTNLINVCMFMQKTSPINIVKSFLNSSLSFLFACACQTNYPACKLQVLVLLIDP